MLGEISVAAVAQGLERLGQAHAPQGLGRLLARGVTSHGGGGLEHRDRRLGEIGEVAGADERILAAGGGGLALLTHLGDLALDESGPQRLGWAAGLVDLLEQGPGGRAEFVGQSLDGAGARGGIGDAMEVRLLDENGLGVAGDAAGEGVGQTEGSAERQHRHGVGAADRRGEGRDGAAHDVSVRIALGHHAPGRLGGDEGRLGVEPAGFLDARPKLPEAAELGDGEELVLIGGETEEDEAPRLVERHAAGLQRAEIGQRRRQGEGELLRFRATGRVDRPAVGDGERTGEALALHLRHEAGEDRRHVGPDHVVPAIDREHADRIEAEANVHIFRRDASLLHEVGEHHARIFTKRAELELDGDAPLEMDALEHPLQQSVRRRQAHNRSRRRSPGTRG